MVTSQPQTGLPNILFDFKRAGEAFRDYPATTETEIHGLGRARAEELRKIKSSEEFRQKINLFICTCLGSPHRFDFYIGVRAFQPFLDDMKLASGTDVPLTETERNNIETAIRNRAKKFGLEKLFAALADNQADILAKHAPVKNTRMAHSGIPPKLK